MKKPEQPQEPVSCHLNQCPRCQAKSKTSGKRCGQPAMNGKRVCYYHGGMSPGAPIGNQHAFKHGLCSAKVLIQRKRLRELIKEAKETLREIDGAG